MCYAINSCLTGCGARMRRVQRALWPDDRVLRDLERIQGDLLQLEPDLLACPPHSLHLSVLPLLAVRTEYDLDKAQIWSAEGARWLRGIAAIVRESHAFTIRFDRLVATRSAVIALAARADHVIALREELAHNLDLPASSVDQVPSIAHVTLFRYKRPLIDPRRFLAGRFDRARNMYLGGPRGLRDEGISLSINRGGGPTAERVGPSDWGGATRAGRPSVGTDAMVHSSPSPSDTPRS